MNKTRTVRQVFAGLVVAGLMLGGRPAYAQPCAGYEVQIIQAPACPPFGPRPTHGLGLSAQGNVVGHYRDCANAASQAFMWTEETGFVTIPTPPENISSIAYDIEGTRIVGIFDLSGDGLSGLAFLYDTETGEFTNLGTLPGGTQSAGNAVNSAGQIGGYWGNHVFGPWQTFIWENGEMIDLGPLIGGIDNRGFDINEAGSICGRWRSQAGAEMMAFLWHDGRMTDLGPIPGGFTSEAESVNIHNQVAGWGILPDPDGSGTVTHAFLWENGRMIDLGTLPGFARGRADGINDAGTIVGQSWAPGLTAFIWQDGVMTDLNELIPPEFQILTAEAINNAGQITGDAIGAPGTAAVLLTPIEPPVGDLDGDCTVGASDLLILLADWGPCKGCPSDLDGNGSVGASDLLILLVNWG